MSSLAEHAYRFVAQTSSIFYTLNKSANGPASCPSKDKLLTHLCCQCPPILKQRPRFAGEAAAGACTVTPGVLSYYEIEQALKNTTIERDTTNLMSAWGKYGSNSWVSFDDETTLRFKMCYARSRKLGGVMVWDTEMDDNQFLIGKIKNLYDSPSCSDFAPPVCPNT